MPLASMQDMYNQSEVFTVNRRGDNAIRYWFFSFDKRFVPAQAEQVRIYNNHYIITHREDKGKYSYFYVYNDDSCISHHRKVLTALLNDNNTLTNSKG